MVVVWMFLFFGFYWFCWGAWVVLCLVVCLGVFSVCGRVGWRVLGFARGGLSLAFRFISFLLCCCLYFVFFCGIVCFFFFCFLVVICVFILLCGLHCFFLSCWGWFLVCEMSCFCFLVMVSVYFVLVYVGGCAVVLRWGGLCGAIRGGVGAVGRGGGGGFGGF